MKPEKRHLIHDLLDGQLNARREATLLAVGRLLRRRRGRRAAFRTLGAMTFLVLASFALQRMMEPQAPVVTAVPPPPTLVQSLNDAELLALFPNTPVGLITLENGRKQLIFPRPGDEERFIKRF